MDKMSKEVEKLYKEILFKIGYYRNKNSLSARDTSLRLGYSDSFVNRIERQAVELKVSTLLKFLELVEITPLEFFKQDKELLETIKSLRHEDKATILDLAKKLKK